FPPAHLRQDYGGQASAALLLEALKRSGVGSPSSGATRLIILDGAHNPTKMKEFLKSFKKLFPKERKVFIIGFKFDKDIEKMLRQIVEVADEIIITEFNRATDMSLHSSADTANIKNQILKIKSDTKVTVEKDSRKVLRRALAIKQYSNSTIIVVTGSLYLVGEIRNKLW
ncbi:MAG: cyanophycin synthetase, partial [Patescibacteria group bacterium]